jgi:NAD(P)-dependent dehydrogenase (short-subunit alcohol dehydrogenase family)
VSDDDLPVCLLTGASGLLGTELCRQLAGRYRIAGLWQSRRPSVASQEQSFFDPLDPKRSLDENAHPIQAIRCDLGSPAAIDRVVERVLKRYGRVDLLINCAAHMRMRPLVGDDELIERADAHFAVNVTAPLQLTTALTEQFWGDEGGANMRENRSVVNVSSTSGAVVFPGNGQALYAASKAALNMMTGHLASELAGVGVRVNAVAPTTFPRYIPTERVAARVLDLAAGDMTGQVLTLDTDGEHWRSLQQLSYAL